MKPLNIDDEEETFDGEEAPATSAQVKTELTEAIEHFRNAAQLLLHRAATDPKVQNVASEAERVLTKIGTQAEPFARQIGAELTKLVFGLSSSVTEAVASRKPQNAPDPGTDGAKEAKAPSKRRPVKTA